MLNLEIMLKHLTLVPLEVMMMETPRMAQTLKDFLPDPDEG